MKTYCNHNTRIEQTYKTEEFSNLIMKQKCEPTNKNCNKNS